MSTFTNILIDIEEMYGNGMGSSEIAAAINQRYSTVYTSAEVDNAIQELLEDYDDSMDGANVRMHRNRYLIANIFL